jgi:hypothetical protein
MGPRSENWPLLLLCIAIVVGVVAVARDQWIVVAAMVLLSLSQLITLRTQRRNRG